jgi:hypothetical protein
MKLGRKDIIGQCVLQNDQNGRRTARNMYGVRGAAVWISDSTNKHNNNNNNNNNNNQCRVLSTPFVLFALSKLTKFTR